MSASRELTLYFVSFVCTASRGICDFSKSACGGSIKDAFVYAGQDEGKGEQYYNILLESFCSNALRWGFGLVLYLVPPTYTFTIESVVIWWHHRNYFSEIMGCSEQPTVYENSSHSTKWLFCAPTSWDMGFWSSNCSILNPLMLVLVHFIWNQSKIREFSVWNFQ